MKLGAQLNYLKEDSGQILENGVYLAPNFPLTVGQNVSEALAERLVEEGVCEVVAEEEVSADENDETEVGSDEATEEQAEEEQAEEEPASGVKLTAVSSVEDRH